ncbi:hypothetical protein [Sporosarcina highlanderae]|uniref:Uncharacterized protein n=1 Tax=Sporosarcina highlanderae TaxID=3035916 RepID=A0ABT8JLC5_9BACL|nr:hypothetical protein [Sporosarcina highlanderae]MDN4605869.1 hypothetical protein [Sporosarcina highlanderae]
MKAAIDIAFLEEVKKYNKRELVVLVDTIFSSQIKKYNKTVSFGRSVSMEFVAALILSDFDETTSPYIYHGLDQVFTGTWGSIDFSNFMDKVILENSVISYPAWSKAYRYIERNHEWLAEHPCSEADTNSSYITKSRFINS